MFPVMPVMKRRAKTAKRFACARGLRGLVVTHNCHSSEAATGERLGPKSQVMKASQNRVAKRLPNRSRLANRSTRSRRRQRFAVTTPSHSPFQERLWTRFKHFFLTFDSGVSSPPGSSRSCGRFVFCWPSFRSPSWVTTFSFSHPCHHQAKARGEAIGNSGR